VTSPLRRRASSRDIRSESRLSVLHAVLRAKEASRAEIAQVSGLSLATVTTVVSEFMAEGLFAEGTRIVGRVGRPTLTVRLNPSRGYFVGVDMAETSLRVDVYDTALMPVGGHEIPWDDEAPSAIIDGIETLASTVLGEAGIDRTEVLGLGVCLPGLVQGTSTTSIVPAWDWHTRDLGMLRDRLGFPLVIENPLKAVATAELWFGRGADSSSFITVNLGTGVGAGIIVDHTMLRGATNSAGEWGHSLLMLDGRGCRCGRHGCVEAYIGAPGIWRTLREIDPSHALAPVDNQFDFMVGLAAAEPDAQDATVEETIARTGYYLGSALADLVAVINPEAIVLTGWTSWLLGERMLPVTHDTLQQQAPGRSADDLVLALSTVRGTAVTRGVALTALEHFLSTVGLLTTRTAIAL